MWLENIVGLAILILGILYLQQISTWSPDSFRLGLVIRKYKESFDSKIPKEFIKKEIVCNNILFKFTSSTKGFFRAYPKFRGFFKSGRKSYFPSVLGEINIHSNGIAEISWRIPLPLIIFGISIFLILVGSNLEGIYTLAAILTSLAKSLLIIAIFGFFPLIQFGFEKWDLEDGIKELNEKINSDTL